MNKADLVKETTGQEILDRQGKEVDVVQAFMTSAKTPMNVEEAFECLVRAIMKKRAELPPSVIEGRSQNPGGGLKLARQAIDSKSNKKGCCKAG
jgi:GTPase Era involved in 16S rRNA processing